MLSLKSSRVAANGLPMDRIETLAALVSALSIPALVIGRAKRVLTMNSAACGLLGHDATGSHYTSVLRQPAPTAAIEAVLAGDGKRTTKHLGQEGDRDLRYELEVSPLGEGSALGVLITFKDLSDADGLGQMRRDFVANVSHELRTPLTALLGFIETLRGPAANDRHASDRFLAMMETEAERMNRLVADLLSLSRLESEGKLKPEAREDIVAIVREAAETMPAAAGTSPGEISLALPEEELFVRGDRDQLMQVMRNLLENAVKYGGGDTRVTLSKVEREPVLRGPGIIIDVTDNGDGIDPLHLPRLTERFYRVDAHRSREQGGTGLGLAIVKHIIGRHRGRLRIRSTPGEGSTFSVVLPRL